MDNSKKNSKSKKKPQCVNCVYFERQPPTQETFEIQLPQQQFFPCQEFVREELRKNQPCFNSGILKKIGIYYQYRCRINHWQQFSQRDLESKSEFLENIQRKRKCSSFTCYKKEFDQDPDYINRIETIKQEKKDRKAVIKNNWILIIASLTLLVSLFPPTLTYHFVKNYFKLIMQTKQDQLIPKKDFSLVRSMQNYDMYYIPQRKKRGK